MEGASLNYALIVSKFSRKHRTAVFLISRAGRTATAVQSRGHASGKRLTPGGVPRRAEKIRFPGLVADCASAQAWRKIVQAVEERRALSDVASRLDGHKCKKCRLEESWIFQSPPSKPTHLLAALRSDTSGQTSAIPSI